jgi:hypothetical protein
MIFILNFIDFILINYIYSIHSKITYYLQAPGSENINIRIWSINVHNNINISIESLNSSFKIFNVGINTITYD